MIQITDIETQITDFEVCAFSTHYEQEVFTTIQVNYLIYRWKKEASILYLFKDSTRIANRQHIDRNRLCDNAPCPNSCIIANSYSRKNDASSTNPHIIANNHRSCLRLPKSTVFRGSFRCLCRMKNSINMYSRPNPRIITDNNLVTIRKTQFMLISTFFPI